MITITSPRSRSIESTRWRFGGAYVTASRGAVVAAAVAIRHLWTGRGGKPAATVRSAGFLRQMERDSVAPYLSSGYILQADPSRSRSEIMASNIPADVVVIGGGPGGYVAA